MEIGIAIRNSLFPKTVGLELQECTREGRRDPAQKEGSNHEVLEARGFIYFGSSYEHCQHDLADH